MGMNHMTLPSCVTVARKEGVSEESVSALKEKSRVFFAFLAIAVARIINTVICHMDSSQSY